MVGNQQENAESAADSGPEFSALRFRITQMAALAVALGLAGWQEWSRWQELAAEGGV